MADHAKLPTLKPISGGPAPELRGRRVLVVGLGRSGQAAARWAWECGARVTATDHRRAEELQAHFPLPAGITLHLGEHREEDFNCTDLIVLSPGVPADLPQLEAARAAGVPILPEVEFAYRYLEGYFIGITGSNGKTTTTALTGELLRFGPAPVYVAGNIGTPLSGLLLAGRTRGIFVIELSSFQLETAQRLRCQVGAFLNFSPDHLDRHRSLESYLAAKARLFAMQAAADWAVLNRDDPAVSAVPVPGHRLRFTLGPAGGAELFAEGDEAFLSWKGVTRTLFRLQDLRVPGKHNLANALAAAGIAALFGLDATAIGQALLSFPGVPHRLEFVAEVAGVRFYNDSKATNVDAALRAVESFKEPLVLILGGLDKATDFGPLGKPVAQRARGAILLGRAAGKIAAALPASVPRVHVESLEEAVDEAFRLAQPGDVVLLAPACASFDMFQNFEHRGEVFRQAVRRLQARVGQAVAEETR
ncbi:MAG: UDP-N-acetylmuramoyl-L-alanine--D-glutamate ligase [Acidobacteriota bacterium]